MDLSKVNFDNEVLQYLSVRKDELIESHEEYIMSHPEIREVLNDFLSSVLLHKPVSNQNKLSNFQIFRTMYTFTLKNISIHLTQLLSEESRSFWLDHQVLVRILSFKKYLRNIQVFSRRKHLTLLDQQRSTLSQV